MALPWYPACIVVQRPNRCGVKHQQEPCTKQKTYHSAQQHQESRSEQRYALNSLSLSLSPFSFSLIVSHSLTIFSSVLLHLSLLTLLLVGRFISLLIITCHLSFLFIICHSSMSLAVCLLSICLSISCSCSLTSLLFLLLFVACFHFSSQIIAFTSHWLLLSFLAIFILSRADTSYSSCPTS